MKIFLSPSNQKHNTYAYGCTTEADQCGRIADACKKALERNGFEVKVSHYDSLQEKVALSNNWGADLHIPIHTNAHNGKVGGTRVFYYKEGVAGYDVSKAIYEVLRGISKGSSDNLTAYPSLYEIKRTVAPVAYIEAEFHDVPEYAKWIINNTTEIGEAICKGICNYYNIKYINGSTVYKVQVGAFQEKKNAEEMLNKLSSKGFNGYVIER